MPQVLAEIERGATLSGLALPSADFRERNRDASLYRSGQDRESGWKIACAGSDDAFAKVVFEALQGTRSQMLEKVRELNLPHVPFITAPVDEILADPDKYLSELKGDSYYWMLHATNGDPLAAYPKPLVGSKYDLLSEIEQYSSVAGSIPFSVAVSECVDVEYLGNIVVDGDGHLYGELTDAPYPPTRNGMPLRCRFARHPQLDTFRYSSEDTELRAAIYKAIQSIPGEFEGRDRIYDRGYYEFFLIRDDQTHQLKPVFYDYRTHAAFCFVPDFREDQFISTSNGGAA